MEQSGWVRHFRTIVLLLATFFWLQQFVSNNYDAFGWQFRFLTVWGLTFTFASAIMMWLNSTGRSGRNFDSFVSVGAVVNGIVVFMYWKLWLIDPALVNGGGGLPWWKEYYLHALGPGLQMFDALFILGGFSRMRTVLIGLMATMLAYIAWIELLVGPRNSTPTGEVTNGMPYPFLNDMAQPERLSFYGTVIVTSLVFAAIGWGISWRIKRLRAG